MSGSSSPKQMELASGPGAVWKIPEMFSCSSVFGDNHELQMLLRVPTVATWLRKLFVCFHRSYSQLSDPRPNLDATDARARDPQEDPRRPRLLRTPAAAALRLAAFCSAEFDVGAAHLKIHDSARKRGYFTTSIAARENSKSRLLRF